jgi:uncharacterized protein YndB with AHSA1/START domain
VLDCDPPHRIVVAWQVNDLGDTWGYDPDMSHASEFEVNFVPVGDGQTRVEFEHRHIERHGAGARSIHASVGSEGGWRGIIDGYAKAAAAA